MIDARASAAAGCFHINAADGALTSKDFSQIVPDQDTVIGVLSGLEADNVTTVNFVTTMNLTGKTLKAGTLIATKIGQRITAVTITSGGVMAYWRTFEG